MKLKKILKKTEALAYFVPNNICELEIKRRGNHIKITTLKVGEVILFTVYINNECLSSRVRRRKAFSVIKNHENKELLNEENKTS